MAGEPKKPARTVALEEDAVISGPQATDALPSLPGYQPIGVLGAGGQGMVIKALHVELQREVVIKFLLPEYVGHGAMRKRFFQEAQLTAKLVHPNIVQVLTVDEPRGAIVYEYAEGSTLAAKLAATGPLEPMDAARYCHQAARALAEAHAAGVIHRDVKPDNLLVARDGEVKVLDFGLARSDEHSGSATRMGTVLGTPGYMPPEQARGERVTASADIHALGATLFELVTGRLPYEGTDAPSLLRSAVAGKPLSLEAARPDVPAALAGVVDKALSPTPAGRQPDMATLVRELRRFATYGEAKVSSAVRTAATRPVSRVVPAAAPPAPSRRSLLLPAAALIALLAGGGALAFFGRTPAPSPPPPPVEVIVPKAVLPPSGLEPPVAPLQTIQLAPAGDLPDDVSIASAGGRLVAAWIDSKGGLAFSSSVDQGRHWNRWKTSETGKAATVELVSIGGRLHALWAARQSDGLRLQLSTARGDAWSEPASLGPVMRGRDAWGASVCETPGATRMLVCWKGPEGKDEPEPNRLYAAWMDAEGKTLQQGLVWTRRHPGNQPPMRPRPHVGERGATIVFQDRSDPSRDDSVLYVVSSAGRGKPAERAGSGAVGPSSKIGRAPGQSGLGDSEIAAAGGKPWSAPSRLVLPSPGVDPAHPYFAQSAGVTHLLWTEEENIPVFRRNLLIGRWSDAGHTVTDVRPIVDEVIHAGVCRLATSGDRLWALWFDRTDGIANKWSGSRDGGKSWSRPQKLSPSFKGLDDHRGGSLAVDGTGRCWAIYTTAGGGVQATPLP